MEKYSSIIICCCVRNIENKLYGLRSNINLICKLFNKYKIVIIENDSIDNTRKILNLWTSLDKNLHLINLDGLSSKIPSRTLRLSYCRNSILKYIFNEISKGNYYEYTFMLDGDICDTDKFSIEGFKSNFNYDDWSVMTANTKNKYYDIWALRNEECKDDCWLMFNRYSNQISANNAKCLYITKHQIKISETKNIIPVISAFNGAALYKTDILKNCIYMSGVNNDMCEHVNLHKLINEKGGKIFINPKFIIADENLEHTPNISYKPFSENDCEFVSSRGIIKSCSLRNSILLSSCPYIDYDIKLIHQGSTVYVCTKAIPTFVETILPKLKVYINLITGDAYETTETYNNDKFKILNNKYVKKWFAQNCLTVHEKIIHIPIGLDYHTMSVNTIFGELQCPIKRENEIIKLRETMKPFFERKNIIYSNFDYTLIPKELIYYESNNNCYKKKLEYAFMTSLLEEGKDFHQTWEALILGCIPIIKHSNMNKLFDELPVLFINSWSEVNVELLTNTISLFKNKNFNYDKLKLSYWVKQITT